ncbi:DUF6992 family protein [Microbacterium radiodurans]|uniref:DUF2809 domain-containing protein n=1 Tax=Microbacterium radiodurans TaxID=661398 RepID=A0A5J5IPN7_9MICO|nr:hypothetical protein [Microbacterium radiodurans]KAA9085432.1 hypothetical protein F6B42_13295 [Microbacterium radiodurans]
MSSARTVTRTVVRRLTRWGTASMLVGGVLALPGRTRAFGLQTLMWGAIDLALAAITRGRDKVPQAQTLRRILLVNAALDVGYVAAGAHLAVRTPTFGGRLRPTDARGHGLAVVLQGAALFVIDLTAARRLRR